MTETKQGIARALPYSPMPLKVAWGGNPKNLLGFKTIRSLKKTTFNETRTLKPALSGLNRRFGEIWGRRFNNSNQSTSPHSIAST